MMRALFSGVTGLRSHQTRLDVIGNNIANVNTMGFKKASVTFADLYSETLTAAAAASGTGTSGGGGVNAMQIGLGSTVASIAKSHTPGSRQYTGKPMDVAISGDGYYAVQTPTGMQYTRSGNFSTDTMGNLVTSSGYYVQCVTPNHTAELTYAYEDTDVTNLIVANTKISAPSGTIHTGNVTAELQNLVGHEFGFRYEPSTDFGGFTSTTSNNYVASMPTGTMPSGNTLNSSGGLLNMGAVAKALLNQLSQAVQPTNGPGDYQVTFMGTATDTIYMQVDGKQVGEATVTSTFDGTNTAVSMSFADVDGNALGTVDLNYAGDITGTTGTAHIAGDLSNAATGLQNMPAINLEENGAWKLYDLTANTVMDSSVILNTTNQGIGSAINRGDFTLTTQEFGTFRLNLNDNVSGEKELSGELQYSKFTLDINQDYQIDYTTPGAVDEAMLSQLTVDFDKFTNLTVDTKGAVIGQLIADDVVTVGGAQVPRKAGDKVVLGYIVLATFNNPAGLETTGDNMFAVSANSGNPVFATPSTGNAGSLSPSNLEMSNVDLSEEMVNMIITQRGFQANSRIITTTDTMLEELVNLKR